MTVKVLKAHVYAGAHREVGEHYDIDEKFLPVMVASGNAQTLAYEPRDLQSTKPPKQYLRRDMKAR